MVWNASLVPTHFNDIRAGRSLRPGCDASATIRCELRLGTYRPCTSIPTTFCRRPRGGYGRQSATREPGSSAGKPWARRCRRHSPTPGSTFSLALRAPARPRGPGALSEHEPRAVIFDAILVKRSERAPILALARQHRVRAVAVWFCTPLAMCLARNAARPPDQVADECGLRNVFAALEPPGMDEGFAEVRVVDPPEMLALGQHSKPVLIARCETST